MITKRIIDELADYYPPYEGEYYPSHLWKCLRQQYYERVFPHLKVDRNFGTMILGTKIHDMIADILRKEPGVVVKSEVPIRIPHPEDPEIVLSGRADDVIVIEVGRQRYVLEVKTVEDLENQIKNKRIPKIEHVAQLNVYLRAYPKSIGVLLYIDRTDFSMEEFVYEFDEQLYKKTLERAKRLHEALKAKVPPEPEAKQNHDMQWQCKFCYFSLQCERDYSTPKAPNTEGLKSAK